MAYSGFEHAYLSTNGVTLHVVRAGPEDGPLVVLLHGFPEFWFGWRRQIGALAQAGFRVLAPDQRGYNLSDKPLRVEDYDLDVLAEDVVGLIQAEGRKQAFVCGHDWGAAVTWWAAMKHPDRVARAAVVNLPHPDVMRAVLLGGDLRQIRRSWYMFLFQLPWFAEHAFRQEGGRRQFRRMRATGRADTFSDADEAHYLEAWRQPDAPRAMVDWYRASARRAFTQPISDARIEPPMHVIWGRKDPLLSEDMVAPSLARCAAGEVTWLDDATHWPHHEAPERVLEILRAHFGK